MTSSADLAILGQRLNDALCKALNIDPSRVRRIIIDSEFNSAVIVHVELFGTRMLQLEWDALLAGSNIKVVNVPEDGK